MSIDERSRVTSPEELRERVEYLLATYDGETVLVEEFMPGREFTVGLLGNREPEIVAVMEVVPADPAKDLAQFVYGVDEKRNCATKIRYRIPDVLTPQPSRPSVCLPSVCTRSCAAATWLVWMSAWTRMASPTSSRSIRSLG